MEHQPILPGRRQGPGLLLGRVVFASRWLLAPFYIGLIFGLAGLLVRFVRELVVFLSHAMSLGDHEFTIEELRLIDFALVGNLLLIVIVAGYDSFVFRLDATTREERLSWIGRIGFSELKLKLMASLVAIAAIRVLEGFMAPEDFSNRDLAWIVGIMLVLVFSGVMLAVMDRVSNRNSHRPRQNDFSFRTQRRGVIRP